MFEELKRKAKQIHDSFIQNRNVTRNIGSWMMQATEEIGKKADEWNDQGKIVRTADGSLSGILPPFESDVNYIDLTGEVKQYIKKDIIITGLTGKETIKELGATSTSHVISKYPLKLGAKYLIEGLPKVNYTYPYINFYKTNDVEEDRVASFYLNNSGKVEFIAEYPYISFYCEHDFGSEYPIWDVTDVFRIKKATLQRSLAHDENGNQIVIGSQNLVIVERKGDKLIFKTLYGEELTALNNLLP